MNRYLTSKEIGLIAGFLGILFLGSITESCKDQWFPSAESSKAPTVSHSTRDQ